MWHLPLSAPIIGVSNGDTISFPSSSIEVDCPVCGTVGINDKETRAQVLGKEIRGLYAILRSVSLKGDDLRKLAAIAVEAKESGSRPEEVAEKIKATVPKLQPTTTVVVEAPSGEEHLLEEIMRELRSSLDTSNSTDSPDVESKSGARSDHP